MTAWAVGRWGEPKARICCCWEEWGGGRHWLSSDRAHLCVGGALGGGWPLKDLDITGCCRGGAGLGMLRTGPPRSVRDGCNRLELKGLNWSDYFFSFDTFAPVCVSMSLFLSLQSVFVSHFFIQASVPPHHNHTCLFLSVMNFLNYFPNRTLERPVCTLSVSFIRYSVTANIRSVFGYNKM